jgi:hypothetical protein
MGIDEPAMTGTTTVGRELVESLQTKSLLNTLEEALCTENSAVI